jgi:hypothetical protein
MRLPRWSILVTSLVLAACTPRSEPENVQRLLVAENAYEVQEHPVAGGAVTQLAYKVRLEFPKQAISTERVTTLREKKWVECSVSSNWEGFLDKATIPERYTHQVQRAFVKQDELLVAGMLYYSRSPGGKKSLATPDNNEQNVVVMKYDLGNEAVKQQIAPVFPQCVSKK